MRSCRASLTQVSLAFLKEQVSLISEGSRSQLGIGKMGPASDRLFHAGERGGSGFAPSQLSPQASLLPCECSENEVIKKPENAISDTSWAVVITVRP